MTKHVQHLNKRATVKLANPSSWLLACFVFVNIERNEARQNNSALGRKE